MKQKTKKTQISEIISMWTFIITIQMEEDSKSKEPEEKEALPKNLNKLKTKWNWMMKYLHG